MIKDTNYYRQFDLHAAGVAIREPGKERGEFHEVFGDAISALGFTCNEREIPASLVIEILGEPDRLKEIPGGEIWEYDWSSFRGHVKYSSTTPFVMQDGILVGVQREEA